MSTLTDCPTFIDLKAAAAALPAASGAQDDPFGEGCRMLPVKAGPCSIGIAVLAAGSGSAASGTADRWLFVESGQLALAHSSGELLLQSGESCVIGRDTPFDWHCEAPARLVIMAYPGGESSGAGIVAIDNGAALAPSNPPAAHLLLGETPSCRSNNHFASADETFKCGIWDSTPYQRTPIFFHHTELMHLLDGEVSFTDAAGRSATFRKGDTFIIEQGAECSWDSQVNVAKIYAQFRPAS